MKMNLISLLLLVFSTCAYASSSESPSQSNDEKYMQMLVKLAHQNPKAPFAAMIVETKTGKILCEGLNHSSLNPTFHGEMVAINNCAAKYPGMKWSETTLYTTAEPCSMCASAIVWADIPHLVYGTSIPSLINLGWDQINIRAQGVVDKSPFYHGDIKGGILSDETDKLFVREHAHA